MSFPSNVVNRYIKTCGDNCPYCGSPDISSQMMHFVSGNLVNIVKCDMCNKEWREKFKLVGLEEV